MNKKYILLMLVFVLVLGLLSYRTTFALFADSATSSGNTFTAANQFPTPTPSLSPTPTPTPTGPQVGDVVINEVFNSGSDSEEWVELLNKTSTPVDVSGWIISDAISSDSIPASTIIPASGYAVIVVNESLVTVPGSALKITLSNGAIGSGLNGTGEHVVLKRSDSTTIDQMSYGSNTDAFSPSAPVPTSGQSLARISDGTDTDTKDDWQLDSSPTIGIVNSL